MGKTPKSILIGVFHEINHPFFLGFSPLCLLQHPYIPVPWEFVMGWNMHHHSGSRLLKVGYSFLHILKVGQTTNSNVTFQVGFHQWRATYIPVYDWNDIHGNSLWNLWMWMSTIFFFPCVCWENCFSFLLLYSKMVVCIYIWASKIRSHCAGWFVGIPRPWLISESL